MTESTALLTSSQAAARLGVKPATLYAYVSRGLLPRHRSADGRTSLFDPADVARLAKRGSTARGTPSDVLVASELTSTDGGLWFRGVDALQAARERSFEDVASWLWTGRFTQLPWHCDAKTVAAAKKVQGVLPRRALHVDRLPLVVAAFDRARPDDARTASQLMSCLVEALPGDAAGDDLASRLSAKLGGDAASVPLLETAMSLVCEQGLTKAALAARLAAAAGGSLAEAVTAAMATSSAVARALSVVEQTLDEGFSLRALDDDTIAAAFPKEPYKTRDPRADALFELLHDAPFNLDMLRDDLRRRGDGPPSAALALAVLTRASGMPVGSAGTILLVARTAGWMAHALEEHRQPTPYRPRLAYTGPAPRQAPGRTLDAVRNYLDG